MLTAVINILRSFWIKITGAVALIAVAIWHAAGTDIYQELKGSVDWTNFWPRILQWLDDTAKYLASPVGVPYFIFVIWVIASIVCIVFLVRGKLSRHVLDIKDYRNYTTDVINGVLWSWSWGGRGIDNGPNCYCTKCAGRMNFNRSLSGGRSLICSNENCRDLVELDRTLHSNLDLSNRVSEEIHRRVRSGEFIDIVKKQQSE